MVFLIILLLSNKTSVARLCLLIGIRESELSRETNMGIIYSSTVLTEADCNSIIWASIGALASENHSFSSDSHLMDESLCDECIYNSIESCEVHSRFSLFSDEFLFHIRKSDTSILAKEFNKSFTRFCNARFWHKNGGNNKKESAIYWLFL